MRKHFAIGCMILAVLLLSCADKESNNPLEGTWVFASQNGSKDIPVTTTWTVTFFGDSSLEVVVAKELGKWSTSFTVKGLYSYTGDTLLVTLTSLVTAEGAIYRGIALKVYLDGASTTRTSTYEIVNKEFTMTLVMVTAAGEEKVFVKQ